MSRGNKLVLAPAAQDLNPSIALCHPHSQGGRLRSGDEKPLPARVSAIKGVVSTCQAHGLGLPCVLRTVSPEVSAEGAEVGTMRQLGFETILFSLLCGQTQDFPTQV